MNHQQPGPARPAPYPGNPAGEPSGQSILRVQDGQLFIGQTVRPLSHNPWCPALALELRREPASGGVVAQCLSCGQKVVTQPIAHAELLSAGLRLEAIAPLDQELLTQFRAQEKALEQQLKQLRREQYTAEFRERLARRYQHPDYQRNRVIATMRDQGYLPGYPWQVRLCQNCRQAPASHTHHLRYRRDASGEIYELALDLVSLCPACHGLAHPDNPDLARFVAQAADAPQGR